MSEAGYGIKTSNYFEDTRDEMLAFVPTQALRILEVGCGNAAFAARLKSTRAVHITVIESHAPAAEVAAQRVDRVLMGSFEDSLQQLRSEIFDCVVLNDVLEHLVDPWEALRQLGTVLANTGVVVASIPNVRYLPVFKDYLLRGDWQYQRDGVLDRTHLRFFTEVSIRDLFTQSGYAVKQLQGINGVPLPWKFAMLSRLMGGALQDARFKQFACVAQRAEPN